MRSITRICPDKHCSLWLHAGVPSEAELWGSNRVFIWTTTWPDTQAKIGKLIGMGLHWDNDLELNFAKHIGQLTD
jgi:hypothetical protein